MRDPLLVPHLPWMSAPGEIWLVEPLRFWGAYTAAASARPALPMTFIAGKGGKSVAVVEARGLLMKGSSWFGTSTRQIRENIRAAAADPNVSGVLLAIDSPGGMAAGTSDLATDVKAATRKKPVWAQIEDLGASAAYWLASQADMIFANSETTEVGSIGTYQTVYDLSGAAEREGVKVFHFATGPLKGAGAPGTVLTDVQQADFQRRVDAVQASFDAAVRSGRSMTAAQLTAVRSGGVFPAKEALALKLIDGVQGFDRTLSALASAK